MAQEAQDAPPRETYNYVLTLEGKNPHLPWLYAHYDEAKESQPTIFKGDVLPLLFVKNETTMMGAWKRGWTNLTEEWFAWLDEITPKPTTDWQELIVEQLKVGSTNISPGNNEYEWYTKSTILEETGVPETVWRTAIKTLKERDLVEKSGFGKATKYRLK